MHIACAQLEAMRERDPDAKALVFTHFSSSRKWLRQRLTAEGYKCRSLAVKETPKNRSQVRGLANKIDSPCCYIPPLWTLAFSQVLEAFQRDAPTAVLLLSVRVAALAMNLTAASHVFILEPCLSPALEDQAAACASRAGQGRPIFVRRLYAQVSFVGIWELNI